MIAQLHPALEGVVHIVKDVGVALLALAALAFFFRTTEDLRTIRRILEKQDTERK